MSAVGMGAVYRRTSSGARLRQSAAATGPAREAILTRYYDPHHARLDELTASALEHDGRPLLIDLHSFPRHALPYERDHSLARPEFCIGTDALHTPEALAVAAERVFAGDGLRTVRNQPFSGSLVPGRFYEVDRRVSSIMTEVRRDLYMDERTSSRTSDLTRLQTLLSELIAELAGFVSIDSNNDVRRDGNRSFRREEPTRYLS